MLLKDVSDLLNLIKWESCIMSFPVSSEGNPYLYLRFRMSKMKWEAWLPVEEVLEMGEREFRERVVVFIRDVLGTGLPLPPSWWLPEWDNLERWQWQERMAQQRRNEMRYGGK